MGVFPDNVERLSVLVAQPIGIIDYWVQRHQALILMGALRLLPAARGHSQSGCKIYIAEGCLACMQALLLQPHAAAVQILDPPRNPQGVQAITPVMKNLSRCFWHRIAAHLVASGGLEAVQTFDESETGFLAEVVVLATAAGQLSIGGMVSQPQVLQHQSVALLN